VTVETPQEDICFFLGMEWGLGGGENGGREFSWVVWSGGTGKIPFFLLQIQKKLTKIWKFSPIPKKHKIDQN
jgi:hypothetical protein